MDLYNHFRSQLRSLNTFELHKKLINHYVLQSQNNSKLKKDIDIIRENHKFLWDEEEPNSWEEQLAKKYYDKLYKEYCISDLSRYKEGKVALRWQTEAELVSGKGQFICGDKLCLEKEGLRSWEVNFGYVEFGQKKNALVKLRLCSDCSYKLNYKHKKKEIKKKRKLPQKHVEDKEIDHKMDKEISVIDTNSENTQETIPKISNDEEHNIWSIQNKKTEEKSREEDFQEFLEQLLL